MQEVLEVKRNQNNILFMSSNPLAGSDKVQLYNQLCAILEPTSVGEILRTVVMDCEELYKRYLHDFVRLAHRCKHKNQEEEYEVRTIVMATTPYWL